jgi:hypothetical protein
MNVKIALKLQLIEKYLKRVLKMLKKRKFSPKKLAQGLEFFFFHNICLWYTSILNFLKLSPMYTQTILSLVYLSLL